MNLQLAGLTQLYDSCYFQEHVIPGTWSDRLLNAIRNSLARKTSRAQKTSETKHSFLTFLICEIHSVSYKFSYKGLPFSKVGPPDLRYLISRECWHSAVNFGAVKESIVHFLDQVRFTFKRKTFKKTRYERNSFNGHRVNCSRKKNITSLHLTYAWESRQKWLQSGHTEVVR